MVRDCKWATTHDSTIFGQEVHPYFPPGSTLVFDTDRFLTFGANPLSGGVLMTHEYLDLRMSFNYLAGQNRDNKCTIHGTKLPSRLANPASNNRGLRSQQ